MSHALDRPIWSALATRHQAFAQGDSLAKRYLSSIVPFAATAAHDAESGVCSHPDFRGRGLGRLLSLFVANQIMARGEVPYLHAYATNAAATRLYESIGFRLRSTMNMAVVQHAA